MIEQRIEQRIEELARMAAAGDFDNGRDTERIEYEALCAARDSGQGAK